MFDNSISAIKTALSPFCRILDSFEHINMYEHLNEVLCFVGIFDYKTTGNYTAVNGEQFSLAEVKIVVDILADRTMTAAQLSSLADNAFVHTIANLGLNLTTLERKSCEFSKAHSRYAVSIELTAEDKIPLPVLTASKVILNGSIEPMLSTYRITMGTKTSQTAMLNKYMLSNVVCPMPNKIVLSGKLPFVEADSALSRYSALSGLPISVVIGANIYNNMLLTGIDLKLLNSSGCEITLEFTEVNE